MNLLDGICSINKKAVGKCSIGKLAVGICSTTVFYVTKCSTVRGKRFGRCASLVPYTASDFCAVEEVEDGFVTNFIGQTRLGEMSGCS